MKLQDFELNVRAAPDGECSRVGRPLTGRRNEAADAHAVRRPRARKHAAEAADRAAVEPAGATPHQFRSRDRRQELRASPVRRVVRRRGPQCFRCRVARASRRTATGLRIRLSFDTGALAGLPWEYMFDERSGDFVGLSEGTPIVRYLRIGQPPRPLAVDPPLRMLGLIASPADRAALDTAAERERLENALQDLRSSNRVELHWAEGESWRALQHELRKGPWHLFHFVGHGGFDTSLGEGVIALVNETGGSELVSATNLGRLLGDHQPMRLAVLNACEGARADDTDIFSSVATTLVRRGTPAVVGMQYEITDTAAIEVARVFYEAIADGLPVDLALTDARKAVCLAMPGSLEWGVPVLYTHTDDGVLFKLTAPAAPATTHEQATRQAVAAATYASRERPTSSEGCRRRRRGCRGRRGPRGRGRDLEAFAAPRTDQHPQRPRAVGRFALPLGDDERAPWEGRANRSAIRTTRGHRRASGRGEAPRRDGRSSPLGDNERRRGRAQWFRPPSTANDPGRGAAERPRARRRRALRER